jgi:mono/diheme cytochrome c family protein
MTARSSHRQGAARRIVTVGFVLLAMTGPVPGTAQGTRPVDSQSAAQPAATGPVIDAPRDAAQLYQQHCAACHGARRTGAMGPALLPESLERIRDAEIQQVIRTGRPATQMPAFAGDKVLLDSAQVEALARFIKTPVVPAPTWTRADIEQSRTFDAAAARAPAERVWRGDPMNLFVVVEGGDHHVSLVDGDRFEVVHRFPTRFALHGGPKFSPDGRYVYFGSRDGWITKYDLWQLNVVAEVRAGLNMRNIAVSADGKWVMAANYLPHSVVLFDADLQVVREYAATARDGTASSRVSAVYDAAPRKSFVVALKDVAELWEISYNPDAEPVFEGYVHDYRMGEAIARRGQFAIRRTQLDEPLDDFFFDAGYRHAIGAARPKTGSDVARGQVVNLDIRRRIATLDLPGLPHLGSGITWPWKAPDGHMTTVLASPNLRDGVVTVIDMQTWKTVQQVKTLGPGFFLRSHEASRYAWVDAMMGPRKDTLMLIDKQTLQPAATLTATPGKTLAHVEFTHDGRYALASLWENDGAIVVYDAQTLAEVKRLPMSKPVGKYNLGNKIGRSAGTSH